MHIWIHKTHHSPNLEKATTFPLIVFFVIIHKGYIQMSFCPGTPNLGVLKFPKLGLLWLCRTITFCANLQLRWCPKKSCSFHWDLSNDMWYTTCTQVNQGDSWLLVVRIQIDNLIPDFSFGHNLYFKYSNGTCEPIWEIYVPRAFQWYNEILNPMSFYPYNFFLKIQESIGTLTPQVGAHLGVCGFIPSHSPTLPGAWNVSPILPFRFAPLQALALVASSRLKSW